MENNSTASSGGIGLSGLLAILFIGLKLAGVIEWSWVWVLSPIWIPISLFVVMFLVFGALALVAVAFD